MAESTRRMPIEVHIDASEEAVLCAVLADLFDEAAETDCYVTRALIEALARGLRHLSERDFGNMLSEVDDEDLYDWMSKQRSQGDRVSVRLILDGDRRKNEHAPGLGGTEEDLADLRRTGFAA